MRPEGWYVDPFGEHDDRWFEDGVPTSLVRDKGVESRDPPPDTSYSGPLEPVYGTGAPSPDDQGPDDLRRADRDTGSYDPAVETEAAWDSFGETMGGD